LDDVPSEATLGNQISDGRRRAASDDSHDEHLFSAFAHDQHAICDESEGLPAIPIMPAVPKGPLRHPPTVAPSSSSARCVLCLVGDSLELMMAPGDVLAIKSQGRLTEIGTAHGVLGHVLLVLSPPTNVIRQTDEGLSLQAVWPGDEVEEIWRVRTLESTRQEKGLHEAEMLLYVDRNSGQLILIGEDRDDGTLVMTEHETVELWQSPAELRSQIRIDLMAGVLSEMKENEASWSHVTVARAILSSAQLTVEGIPAEQAMEMVRACWLREPICTSVVIIFWQRYLCELACGFAPEEHQQSFSSESVAQQSLDLLLRWMPLKADRGLPGDLLGAMKSVGWVTVAQIPRIFRPMLFTDSTNHAFDPAHHQRSAHDTNSSRQAGAAAIDDSCAARVTVAREVATGGA